MPVVATRTVAWMKDSPWGAETARVEFGPDYLRATGVAIGSDPAPYRLDYELETATGFITRRVVVQVRGDEWSRRLELTRSAAGVWAQNVQSAGAPDRPDAGGDLSQFGGALDPDLGLSPLFNTLPVRREEIHKRQTSADFLMLWISVPDLAIYPSRQRYTYLAQRSEDERVVRFEATGEDDDFVADVVFDSDGVVVDYPGIARRVRPPRTAS